METGSITAPKVDKKIKVQHHFDQPLLFQENSEWVISQELYTQERNNLFKDKLDGLGEHGTEAVDGINIRLTTLKENRVRYSCQGFESGYNGKLIPLCGWWLRKR